MTNSNTQIASHRGGAALWPENSQLAFRETLKLDVEQIEFDVQLSADGFPVIFHDDQLDRVTNGKGPLCALTLAELKELEIFKGGGNIMTLEEGLEILAPSEIIPRCELKPGPDMIPYDGIIDKSLDIFKAFGLIERTIITSFHLPTVSAVRKLDLPLLDVLWLVANPIVRLTSYRQVARLALAEGIRSVSLHQRLLDEDSMAIMREEGADPSAFAVLEDDAIQKVLVLGVPVFTTDRPDAAIAIRQQFED